ncbi:MAG TPA: rhomboid family intramembrane serine protease [Ktedonobacterales bacterium]|nr:rhomboid family intramembrane serine protease [Ktedonobacterales bacterium]
MEVPVGAEAYIQQGRAQLLQGQARDAAVAFAHAVKIDPNLVAGHLGLAQANLALGSYGLVHMACRRVQELEPAGTDANLAQALIFVLDRRYDRAVDALDRVAAEDPANAYAHALRGYCLHRLGRDYEAALAESKAARQAGNIDFAALFPKVEQAAAAAERPTAPTPSQETIDKYREPPWQPPAQIRRQVAQVRFATRNASIITIALIVINVVVFLICGLMAGNILNPIPDSGILLPGHQDIYIWGVLDRPDVIDGHQYWRIITAMFLHVSWLHVGLNMLSLYFIGRPVEQVYGRWRYLLIYFGTGIFGGLLVLLLSNAAVLGASGAIFGVFGTLGIFLWYNRRAFGSAMLSQWVFWLVLNLAFTFGFGDISVSGHIGGLSMGLILGLLLMPGFWTPVRVRMRRGQTGEAMLFVLKPLLVLIAVAAALILLAYLLGSGR